MRGDTIASTASTASTILMKLNTPTPGSLVRLLTPLIIASGCGGAQQEVQKTDTEKGSQNLLCVDAVTDAKQAIKNLHERINQHYAYLLDAKRSRTDEDYQKAYDYKKLTILPHLDTAGSDLARVKLLCGPDSQEFKQMQQRYGQENWNYFRAEHLAASLPNPDKPEVDTGYEQMPGETVNCMIFVDRVNALTGHFQKRITQFYKSIEQYEKIETMNDFERFIWYREFTAVASAIDNTRNRIASELRIAQSACQNSDSLMQVTVRAAHTQSQFNDAFNYLGNVEEKKRAKVLQ